MMKQIETYGIKKVLLGVGLSLGGFLYTQAQKTWRTDFEDPKMKVKQIGRGSCKIENGVLKSTDAYASFGSQDLKNYVLKFKARAPQDAEQVQIWAGFRAFNRNDRYILGIRGGIQNTLYLSRMGYMGADEFIGLRQLHFEPKPGVWYNVKVEVCGNRIRVFLNDETLPRIDVVDKNANLAPQGEVTLGGSWIPTEFDELSIQPVTENYFEGVSNKEWELPIVANEKSKRRVLERSQYQARKIETLASGRTEVSLDGTWLFMPEHEMKSSKSGADQNEGDQNWHTISVPNFWNPIRIWLHGESFEGHPKGVSDTYFQQETDRCKQYTFDYTKTKVAWYRQWVELPAQVASKHMTLDFDAVSKVAEVYINGKQVGSHVGMFGNFSIDATSHLKPGKNLIAVKVIRDYIKNIQNGDEIVDVAVTVPVTNNMLKDIAHGFYKDDPAGIWQPVKLVITDQVKIEDVFIQPNLHGGTIEVRLKNYTNKSVPLALQTSINDAQTKSVLYKGVSIQGQQLQAGEEKTFSFELKDLQPKLWSPQHPNLYNFQFQVQSGTQLLDQQTIRSGFRTFEARDGFFWLNGQKYWLRGANHTPFALAPNDSVLARSFYQTMKAGNMDVTRTHTTPYNELWMASADENGVGISFEGTWPWLMINSSMPDKTLIDLWADEFLDLLKKYRNHPSLLFWTVNNEMKFYDNEPDFEQAKKKMRIISDVVKRMRKVDKTRPICFDSNYKRNKKKFGAEFFDEIDDGDIDDDHKYINWYDYSIFKQFKGEFQKNARNEGRPLISQEMSTGYANAETGHATRFYNLVHQNPQTLIGYQSYEYANPNAFLNVHAFITGELAEALRRSNDKASGILHFALLTWFRNVYDAKKIAPYPTYFAMQRAMQPVLVSAEIWGRNFYAGKKFPVKFCVVNDLESGRALGTTQLSWQLVNLNGQQLATGVETIPAVAHAARQWVSPNIQIPANLPAARMAAQLKLTLTESGKTISTNEYTIQLAQENWSKSSVDKQKKIALVDGNGTSKTLDYLNVNYTSYKTLNDALQASYDLLIVSGLDSVTANGASLDALRARIRKGDKVLVLQGAAATKRLFSDYITGWIVPTEGDIVNMEMPESRIFNDIGLFDLRYFNDEKSTIPTVCNVAYQIKRDPHVVELANQTKIHGYIRGDMMERSEYVKTIKGFPLLRIEEGGAAIVSGMQTEKALTDPIAARLLVNMIQDLLQP